MYESAQQEPHTWQYKENILWDEKHRIKGHTDGNVSKSRFEWFASNATLVKNDLRKACKEVQKVDEGKISLLEMKLVGSRGYKEWINPVDTPSYYKTQTCLYQHMTGLNDTIFYLMERDQFQTKGIVFPYERNWVKDAHYKAIVIWKSIKEETLPESFMACKTPMDKRAKGCVHCPTCWSKKFDVKAWIAKCKAAQPERRFLDLSSMEFN